MSGNEDFDPSRTVSFRKQTLQAFDNASGADRLRHFLLAQPGMPAQIDVSNLRAPNNGASSGTVIFTARFGAPSAASERDFVLRHATPSGLFHEYNLPGQFAILKGLQDTGVPIPRIVGQDETGAVLGTPGYVMERVEGQVPPASYYKSGVFVDASPADRRAMMLDAIAALAKLHALDWRRLGVDFLLARGRGRTAVERDLDWYWQSLCWGCPSEVERHQPVRQWFLDHQPPEGYVCLNHGDAQLANYLFRDNSVAAILDWELAAIGNPAIDIGWQSFAHSFLGLGCEPLPGALQEDDWKVEYERISGRALEHWDYYKALAIFKVHAAMELVFRGAPPELQTAKQQALGYTWQRLQEQQDRYRRRPNK